jgi:dissimilatory sulfite reductase (desulfoviridin) alpha/beta subunit
VQKILKELRIDHKMAVFIDRYGYYKFKKEEVLELEGTINFLEEDHDAKELQRE